jgi:hypothetical protein
MILTAKEPGLKNQISVTANLSGVSRPISVRPNLIPLKNSLLAAINV